MKPPLNRSKTPQKVLDFEIQRSLMRIPEQNQPILQQNPENSGKPVKTKEKPLKNPQKPAKNDLRYSRGLSWSHDSEVFSRAFANMSRNPDNFPANPNEIPVNLNEIAGIPHKTSEIPPKPSPPAPNPLTFREKLRDFFENSRFFACFRGDRRLVRAELLITINELRSRESYEVFAESLKKLDRGSLKTVRFRGLKSRFLIQYWRELEFLIREFPEICALKFEATRLELEHCGPLLYFLLNKVKKIQTLSLNFNGLRDQSLEFLFCERLKLADFPRLASFSLKNNGSSAKLAAQLQELAVSRGNFRYKLRGKSKKYAFLRLWLDDCELDDRTLKKLTHALSESHGSREIKRLSFANNSRITERGWHLFSSKYVGCAALGLRKLSVSGCNLSEHSLARLSDALQENSALGIQELDLSDNANFTYWGLAVFARKVLKRTKTLETLKMVRCGLNDQLVKGICDGLWLDDANFLEVSRENRGNTGNYRELASSDREILINPKENARGKAALSLKFVDFSQNWNVSEHCWKQLLFTLASFAENLEALALRDCVLNEKKLKEILSVQELLKLRSFDVSSNESITETLGWPLFASEFLMKTHQIRTLCLAKCNLNSEKLAIIASSFTKNPLLRESLRELDLAGNCAVNDADFADFLSEIATKVKQIRALGLRNTGLNDRKLAKLAEKLRVGCEIAGNAWFSCLKSLDLSENRDVGPAGFAELLEIFASARKSPENSLFCALESLKLEEMALSDEKINGFLAAYDEKLQAQASCALKSLSFSGNRALSPHFFGVFAEFLLSVARISKSPVEISLRNCQFNSEKAGTFAEVLRKAPKQLKLGLLDLSANAELSPPALRDIFVDGKCVVSQLLLRDCRLTSAHSLDFPFALEINALDLSGNPRLFSDEAGFPLISACKRLSSLTLQRCALKSRDFALILPAIAQNNCLKKLDFSGNRALDGESLKAFVKEILAYGDPSAKNLKEKPRLEEPREKVPLHDHKFKSVCNAISLKTASFAFRKLDLAKNQLSCEVWDEFLRKVLVNCKELRELSLDESAFSAKKLESLLNFLCRRGQTLEKLSFKGNAELSAADWAVFAGKLRDLPRLRTLILDECGLDDEKIAGFSQEKDKAFLSLDFLSMNGNKRLTGAQIRAFLRVFPCLRGLSLANCELDDGKLRGLLEFLAEKPDKTLHFLDISGNSACSDAAFADFCRVLRETRELRDLVLRDCGLSPAKTREISEMLEIFKETAINLDFSGSQRLETADFAGFLDICVRFQGLRALNLARSGLTDAILLRFCQAIGDFQGVSRVERLDFSENPRVCRAWEPVFATFGRVFKELRWLSLKGCALDSEKLAFLSKGRAKSPLKSLKFLDLSGNKGLTDAEWGLFFEIFEVNAVETLILEDCELKNPTIRGLLAALAAKLPENKENSGELQEIQKESAIKPEEILLNAGKTPLKTLSLARNWAITDVGLVDLFANLVQKPDFCLETLDLSECTLNDAKVRSFAENFSQSPGKTPCLRSLILNNNRLISENGWKSLGNVVFALKNLRNLEVWGCDLDCDGKIQGLLARLLAKDEKTQGKQNKSSGFPEKTLDFFSLSVNAAHLSAGLVVLQQFLQYFRVNSLKIRFSNEDLLLQVFWTPVDLLEILHTFCQRKKKKSSRAKKSANSDTFPANAARKSLKSLIFEPKSLLPFAFRNPQLLTHEEIVLCPETQAFLASNAREIRLDRVILLSYDPSSGDSLLSSAEISRIFEIFSRSAALDSLYLDYSYVTSQYFASEVATLRFLRLLPPKSLVIRGEKLTVNGLKAVFALMYQNYNINEIAIDYDYDSILNQGIAFSLREKLYQAAYKGKLARGIKFCAYKLLSLFVLPAKHYKFSTDVLRLDEYLRNSRVLFAFLATFAGIYLFLAVFLPFFFILPCKHGLSWTSHYVFSAFVVFSLIFEILVFSLIYWRIRPVYLSFHGYVFEKRKTWRSLLKRRSLIFFSLIFSQLAHYDLYYKFSFVRITFACGQEALGIVAGVFLGLHVAVWLYNFVYLLIFQLFFKETREFPFKHINKFLDLALCADFLGVFHALDCVAPYHVVQIPGSPRVFGKFAGLSINCKVFVYFLKFLFKNIPAVVVQSMFLFFRREKFGESDFLVIGSLVLSLLTFAIEFYKFLSVRPSMIYQADFEELVRRNRRRRYVWLKEMVEKRDRVLDEFVKGEQEEMKLAVSVGLENELRISRKKTEIEKMSIFPQKQLQEKESEELEEEEKKA